VIQKTLFGALADAEAGKNTSALRLDVGADPSWGMALSMAVPHDGLHVAVNTALALDQPSTSPSGLMAGTAPLLVSACAGCPASIPADQARRRTRREEILADVEVLQRSNR
jgi:hypothetical protein